MTNIRLSKSILTAFCLLFASVAFAQQRLGDNLGNHLAIQNLNMNNNQVLNASGITVGTTTFTNSSIALQIDGSSKAILIPRVTDLLNATTPSIPLANAINGMIVYDLATSKFYVRQNNTWQSISSASTGYVDLINKQSINGLKTFTSDSGFVATGAASAALPVATGTRLMMMWYPGKGAIRAGNVVANVDSIGQNSTAFGDQSKAIGLGSVSIGTSNRATATGTNSMSIGTLNTANGPSSAAIGSGNYTAGTGSMALGLNNRASASYSVAMGRLDTASSNYSTAIGYLNKSANSYAITMGYNNLANGSANIALGYQSRAITGSYVTAIGRQDTASANYAVAIGFSNGASGVNSTGIGTSNRTTGANSTAIGTSNITSGASSTAIGISEKVLADNSVGLGTNSTINSNYSYTIGNNASVGTGSTGSFVVGNDSNVGNTATNSYAIGYLNKVGDNAVEAFAIGKSVEANGVGSFAIGHSVNASTAGSFAIGDNSTTTKTATNANNQMIMRFAGGYRFYTNATAANYIEFAAGSNGMSVTSDRRKKENFELANGELFLRKIDTMQLSSWNYKTQDTKKFRHYGPMAQDFYTAFGKDSYGTIGNDTTISSTDFDGVNMIAIQGLVKRTNDLKKENDNLKKENEKLVKAFEKQQQDSQGALSAMQADWNEQKTSFENRLKLLEQLVQATADSTSLPKVENNIANAPSSIDNSKAGVNLK